MDRLSVYRFFAEEGAVQQSKSTGLPHPTGTRIQTKKPVPAGVVRLPFGQAGAIGISRSRKIAEITGHPGRKFVILIGKRAPAAAKRSIHILQVRGMPGARMISRQLTAKVIQIGICVTQLTARQTFAQK